MGKILSLTEKKGVDEDYGKEAYRLRPITQAPFYGYFMGGSLLCTCDGLRINLYLICHLRHSLPL